MTAVAPLLQRPFVRTQSNSEKSHYAQILDWAYATVAIMSMVSNGKFQEQATASVFRGDLIPTQAEFAEGSAVAMDDPSVATEQVIPCKADKASKIRCSRDVRIHDIKRGY